MRLTTDTSTQHKYGERAACVICDQDIEYIGRGKWHDRGGNLECPPYRNRDGEIVQPDGERHKPCD